MSTEKQSEILSALMDGEVTELEMRRLLLSLDDADHDRWARWHLVQDVLQGHVSTPVADQAFCTRVREAIINEPAPGRRALHLSLSRVAVAAAVALAVVGGWQMWQFQGATNPSGSGTQMLAISPAATRAMPVSDTFDLTVSSPRVVAGQARVEPVADTLTIQRDDELSRMLENHSRYAAMHGEQGMMPYVRLIDFGAQGNSAQGNGVQNNR
jgi:sigma-E factor negative regulatory protein RseA